MNRVAGKTAIVTGAASGIGAEAARRLAAEGGTVVLADINHDGARAVADEIGGSACALRLDVTASADWRDVVATTDEKIGPVNILVNSAGVGQYAPLDALDEDEFRRVVDINQLGTFLGMKTVVPSMRRAGGGSIVNISSLAGLIGFPYALAYTASKWAVRGMTKSLATELGPEGIRVNSIHPGVIDTPILAASPAIADEVKALPLGRIGRPADVANMILFLASDESGYSTGSEFVLDGGWQAMSGLPGR